MARYRRSSYGPGLALGGLVVVLVFGRALAGPAGVGRVGSPEAVRVIELFTSQGCPKCPPADHLVSELAREPRTIALSYAVSMWDYGGWHDTLAEPAFSQRQHAYAAARGDRNIFTPQAIVDGLDVEAGADMTAILRDTTSLSTSGAALQVPLSLSEEAGKLHIDVGAARSGGTDTASVIVLRVERQRTVDIDRGANSGRSVTYTNAVRAMQKVGEWSGSPAQFELLELKSHDEGYVVFLQAGTRDRPGAILAAAQTGL